MPEMEMRNCNDLSMGAANDDNRWDGSKLTMPELIINGDNSNSSSLYRNKQTILDSIINADCKFSNEYDYKIKG